jgi:uncharacterized protein (TIGR03089 family)
VLLDLPSHWLVPVFLGAAWSGGLAVTTSTDVPHDVVVCGPEDLERHTGGDVVACSLLPFAVRFTDPLPAGVLDYGLLWPGQSDVFVSVSPPSPDTVAWLDGDRPTPQAELLESAATADLEPGVRLLTDLHPATDAGVRTFLAPLAQDGSLVLVRNPAEGSWPARQRDERATSVLRT